MRERPARRLFFVLLVLLSALHIRCSAPAGKPNLAGQWIGELPMEDADTVHVVADLGLLDSRWVGEFDVPEFEIENYPVQVVVANSMVELGFSAADAEFKGRLAGDGRLSGIIYLEHDSLTAEFRRTGDAQFSPELLALEAVAEDSTRVTRLSADGAQLRAQFNADRDQTRLVMLLSPS